MNDRKRGWREILFTFERPCTKVLAAIKENMAVTHDLRDTLIKAETTIFGVQQEETVRATPDIHPKRRVGDR